MHGLPQTARGAPARAPRHLTGFYLTIALGGALGALMVGVAAPLLLPDYFELDLALAVLIGVVLVLLRGERGASTAWKIVAFGAPLAVAILQFQAASAKSLVSVRNFYGVLRLTESGEGRDRERQIVHGAIVHGRQYVDPSRRRETVGYYRPEAGGARAIAAMAERGPSRVAVIGLGAGALVAYGRAGDTYRIYEIKQAVIDMANRDFSFLKDSAAAIEMVLGDARLKLEREPSQRFDVLVVDAFTGDAIPVHLLTLQALDIYLRHLAPGGILAIHVSNRFLVLPPVIRNLADKRGVGMVRVFDRDPVTGIASSEWVLLAREDAPLAHPRIATASDRVAPAPSMGVWTDEFAALVLALRLW